MSAIIPQVSEPPSSSSSSSSHTPADATDHSESTIPPAEEEDTPRPEDASSLLSQFLFGLEWMLNNFREAVEFFDPALCAVMNREIAKLKSLRRNREAAQQLCRRFHQHNETYYGAFKSRDDSVMWTDRFLLIPDAPDLSSRSLWQCLVGHPRLPPDVAQENSQHLWHYISYVVNFARLWNKIPHVFLTPMEEYATELTRKTEADGGNFAGKARQIARFSRRLLKQDQQALDEFIKNIPDIYQGIGGASAINAMKDAGVKLSDESNACFRFFMERQEKGYSIDQISEEWKRDHPEQPELEFDEEHQLRPDSAEKKKKKAKKNAKGGKKKKSHGKKKKSHGPPSIFA